MTPVHVLISDRPADEQAYGAAFAGAIELYRCNSNLEVYERLTAACTTVHVLVVTANQDPLFNLTAAQLLERLLGGTLGSAPELAQLQVVVVGADETMQHPRVHHVSTLDAAIRLVKFGEVESAPRPTTPSASARPVPASTLRPTSTTEVAQSSFFDSIVSSIWDSADRAAAEAQQLTRQRQAAAAQAPVQRRQTPRGRGRVRAGGPATSDSALFATVHQPVTHPQVAAYSPEAAHAYAPTATLAAPVTETGLTAAREFVLPSRGEYRGASPRLLIAGAGVESRAAAPVPAPQPHVVPHHVVGGGPSTYQPAPLHQGPATVVPPQLAQQVHQLVYAPAAVDDPLLGWSAGVQQQLAQQPVAGASPALAHATAPSAAHTSTLTPPAQPRVLSHNGAGATAPTQTDSNVHTTAIPADSPATSRLGRTFGRARERVAAGERAPLTPRIQQHNAPQHTHNAPPHSSHVIQHQSAAMQHAPTASGPAFDASSQLLQRAAASGDVSFG